MTAVYTIPVTSGNEITDLLRARSSDGDGRPVDGSLGIWPATTNLCINGGFETNDTGWQNTNAGQVVGRSTLRSKFGTASWSVVNDGSASYQGAQSAASAISTATPYVWSAWVYNVSGAFQPVISVVELLTGVEVNNPIFATPVICPANTWTKITGAWTSAGAGINQSLVRIYGFNGQAASNFFLDGVQLEQQVIPTPYVETNGGSASRGASRARIPTTAVLSETQSWVAMRCRVNWGATLPTTTPTLFNWSDGTANNRIQLYWNAASEVWATRVNGGASTLVGPNSITHVSGDILTIIFAWTAAAIKTSVNGGAFLSAANANVPSLAAQTLAEIGSNVQTSGGDQFASDLFWLACGTGSLTDANAATIGRIPTQGALESQFPDPPTFFFSGVPPYGGDGRAGERRSRGGSW